VCRLVLGSRLFECPHCLHVQIEAVLVPSKVKHFMGQTDQNLQQRTIPVLGESPDGVVGLTLLFVADT
jgi:hypothetical protein